MLKNKEECAIINHRKRGRRGKYDTGGSEKWKS